MSVIAIGQGWGSRSNSAKVFFKSMTKFVSRPLPGRSGHNQVDAGYQK
jgi:hypothetical protein